MRLSILRKVIDWKGELGFDDDGRTYGQTMLVVKSLL